MSDGPLHFVEEKPDTQADEKRAADAALELSIFEDGSEFGEGVETYAYAIRLSGTTFCARELSRATVDAALAEQTALEREGKRIGAIARPAERMEATSALNDRSLALARSIVEEALVGWSNPAWKQAIPCNAETRAKLTRSIMVRLGDEILAKSYSGRARSDAGEDFLER